MTETDVRSLEELQFDRRFANQFGMRTLRAFVVQLLWRRYQDAVPQVLKALQTERQRQSSELSRVSNLITNLDTYKLRAAASSYVMSFLQSVEKLLGGTLAGNPGQNGQTLAQEHAEEAAGPWLDASRQILAFDAEDLGISNADAKLYGGQQFARLLSEFRAVASTLTLGELSASEVATAAGPSRINNVSNLAWAASDLAQKRVQRALMPLVEQLYRRGSFILKRLADIVERMIVKQSREERQQQTAPPGGGGASFSFGGAPMASSSASFGSVLQAQVINVEGESQEASFGGSLLFVPQAPFDCCVADYPFFVDSVKNLYSEFVDHSAQVTAHKCLDEFYSTRILYWSVNSEAKEALPDLGPADEDEALQAVALFAGRLFAEQRDRIVESVLLKCHNFFLVPMQTDLWGDIQASRCWLLLCGAWLTPQVPAGQGDAV